MTRRRRWPVAALGLAAAVVATACSDGSTGRLVMSDFAFTPNVLRIPAEADGFTLMMDNVGTQPHDLTVDGLPEDAPVHLLLFEGTVDVPYVLPPLPAGTYDIYCSVDGHRVAGMSGRLVVE